MALSRTLLTTAALLAVLMVLQTNAEAPSGMEGSVEADAEGGAELRTVESLPRSDDDTNNGHQLPRNGATTVERAGGNQPSTSDGVGPSASRPDVQKVDRGESETIAPSRRPSSGCPFPSRA